MHIDFHPVKYDCIWCVNSYEASFGFYKLRLEYYDHPQALG